jgi:hypothetical protein
MFGVIHKGYVEKVNFTGFLQYCDFNLVSEMRWIFFKCKNLALKVRGKSKVYPTTGHEDQQRDEEYICALSLTLVLDGVGGKRHVPAALPPGEETRLFVLREARWASDPFWAGAENLAPTGIRSPGRPDSLVKISVREKLFIKLYIYIYIYIVL